MAKAKAKNEESLSLQEAAEAFILLHDSGNYNGRRYNRVLGLLRDAVNKKDKGYGPIMPEDERPDLDADQEQAVEERMYISARVEDLVHPGSRMQKSKEAIDTIFKQAEEGTLAQDGSGARKIAADAKAAAEKVSENAEDVQKVAVVPAPRVTAKDDSDDADKKKNNKK